MKRLFFVVGGILLMIGCETGRISSKLAEVDSLIVREEYDSAYQLLSSIEKVTLKKQADIAYYNLLKVQIGCLVNKPVIFSDSLLDNVITFYRKHNIADKLADAYYYKAIGFNQKRNYYQSALFYKKAESSIGEFGNLYQQHKIAEGLSFVNGRCANYNLQLNYAKKALAFSKQLGDKKRMAYAYYLMDIAYYKLGYEDSARLCLKKIPSIIESVDKREKPYLLSNIGYLFRDSNPEVAKKYLIASLSYEELTASYEHLAEILYKEGKYEEAYQYWRKALTVNDVTPKDNIIRSLIEYDLRRGQTDSISALLSQMIEIRDSIDTKLKDDTIKDLQTRFDHELALKEKDRVFVRGILIMTVIIFVLIGVFGVIYFRRRHLAEVKMLDYQMQINDNLRQIEILQASGTDTKQEVERLNKLIEDIMQNKAPKLDRGRMLYDDIMNGNITMTDWNRGHEQMFLDYYTATHYNTVKKMKSVKRVEKLTPHKLFYLILVKLGKTDEQIQQMMSVSDSTLRGLKHRTKPLS